MNDSSDPARKPSRFAAMLRELREARSLTQQELATAAGLSVDAVSALERGRRTRPQPHTVRALASALCLDDTDRSGLLSALGRGGAGGGTEARAGNEARAGDATGVGDAAGTGAGARNGAGTEAMAGTEAGAGTEAMARTEAGTGTGAVEMPPRTLTTRPPSPPAVTVVGRDDEVAGIVAALRTTPGRLVTLTGPGGVGKTTVALVAADTVTADMVAADPPGGVYFADLTDVTDPDDAIAVVARAAGSHADTVTGLAAHLAGAPALLVLDNLERVAAECGPLLSELLAAAPEAVVLATSRVPLRVRREREIRVAPLTPAAAVRLFGERLSAAGAPPPPAGSGDARAIAHDRAIAQLCQRADGLPLAIELLAAAAARLGPPALLARVDQLPELSLSAPRDLPARQRTMAATVEWSCELLGPAARRLLPRLALVPGSFTLDTVDAIAEAGPRNETDPPNSADATGTLTELIEHSLVTRGDDTAGVARFRLLEPVRRYALDTLTPADREQTRRGVARWALRAAREYGARIRGRGDMPAVEQVEADRHVLRLGYEQLVDARRYDDAAELLWSVWLPLWMTGHTHEGLAWTDHLRGDGLSREGLSGDGLSGDGLSERGRARWLVARAGFNRVAVDLFATAERAMRLAERIDDASLAAEAAIFASAAALRLGDFDGSGALLARAEAHMKERLDVERDVWAAVHVPIGTGDGALLRGDRGAAARHWRTAAVMAGELGSGLSVAAILTGCAESARGEGRLADAAVMLAVAGELTPERDGHRPRAHLAGVAAAVAADLGDGPSARWWEGVAEPDAPAPDTAELGKRFQTLVTRADTATATAATAIPTTPHH
ncbi:helix-turn-helix domain-containing protein [Streptomyces sp. NPDC093085]|uniref:ATP-binding protein n=1 Tax=Streptomyces sp. NPDC093085 TaxID=3155068 RepID=UPI0034313678